MARTKREIESEIMEVDAQIRNERDPQKAQELTRKKLELLKALRQLQ